MDAAVVLFILFVSHLLGAVAAYGGALLALPALVWVTGEVQGPVVMLMLLGGVQAAQIFLYTWRDIDWREAKWMVGVPFLALPIGVASASWLPERGLVALLGVLLLASGGWRLATILAEQPREEAAACQPPPAEAADLPRAVRGLLLVLGGIIHGAFACGGATLVVYAQHTLKRKAAFRATLALLWVFLNGFLLTAVLAQGRLDSATLKLFAVSVPPVLMAGWAGQRIARRMSEKRFGELVAVLLIISGCVTLARIAA